MPRTLLVSATITFCLKCIHESHKLERTTEVDKAAASRFIKHALSEAQLQQDKAKASQLSWKKTSAEEAQESSSSSSEDEQQQKKPNAKPQHKIPPKITSKMLERQQYDKEPREQDFDNEDEVFDQSAQVDDECTSQSADDLLSAKEQGKKDKGKAKANPNPSGDASSSVTMAHATSKRHRPAMDPFVASGLFCIVSTSLSSAHILRTGFVGVGEEEQTTSSPSHVSKKSKASHSTASTPSTVGHASESLNKASKKDKKKKKSKNVNVPLL